MSSAESEVDKKVIKQFLNLSVSSVQHRLAPNSQATLALCLHHRHSSVRLNAITYLMDNLNTVSGLLGSVVFTGRFCRSTPPLLFYMTQCHHLSHGQPQHGE